MAFNLITQAISNNMLLVEIYGEADVFAAPALHDHFINIINAGNNKLIISLEKTTLIDSSGLAVLVNAYKYVKKQNGHFVFVCSKFKLHQMLLMTSLHKLFPIANTLFDACFIASEWHSTIQFITDRQIRKFILWDNYITTISLLNAPLNIPIPSLQNSYLMA